MVPGPELHDLHASNDNVAEIAWDIPVLTPICVSADNDLVAGSV